MLKLLDYFAIFISQPSLTLSSYNANTTGPMVKAIQDVFPIVWPSFTGNLDTMANNIVDLESKLSNIFVKENQDSTIKVDELKSFISSIDIDIYMRNFFLSTPTDRLNGSSIMYTKQANYFKSIDAILKQTDPATLEGYLVW